MSWLSYLFGYPEDNLLIFGRYEAWLVALSIVVAVVTAILALHMATQAQSVGPTHRRGPILFAASVALGGGVWSMHFIGMLAFDLCTPVSYARSLTLMSMVPSVAASFIALNISSRPNITLPELLIGGVLMGAGIGTMHYVGMAAMVMAPALHYDLPIFLLSILVAVALSMLALWIRFGIRRLTTGTLSPLKLDMISGGVMGVAIAGMHYTGMAAARFVPPAGLQLLDSAPQSTLLAVGVAVTTVMITCLVVAVDMVLKYRAMNQSLVAEKTRLRAILDTAVDGIIILNPKGIIVAANQAAEAVFGWSVTELMGRNVSTLMPEPHRSLHDGYLEKYLRTGEASIIGKGREVEALDRHGRIFPMRLAIGHVRLPREDLFVGFVTDITARRVMEKELFQAKEKAEQAANARSAFLANMSHEIRTPMNAIIGFTEVLMGTPLNDEQSRHLSIIARAARSLLHLLNDILDSAKLEKGKLELENVSFSLPELLDTVLSTLGMQARRKGLSLNLKWDPALPEHFMGAPDRIRQVLNNLVGNAIKFTSQGSVELDVSRKENNQVSFKVTDTGIGIEPGRLQTIFDPFTQADVSISRRFGGTGLGTTISKQLVELMDGWIGVSSHLGQGTCFEFCLPLMPGTSHTGLSERSTVKLPPLTILAVDDMPQNLDLLRLILQRNGHNVVCASNGSEALELARSHLFDAVLMDLQMPEMDGTTATLALHAFQREQQQKLTPVIALTASVLDEDKRAARNAGMVGFASKPVDLDILNRELARVLGMEHLCASPPKSKKSATTLLDWDRGIARWGDSERYNQELVRFAIDYGRLALDMDSLVQQQDFASLHQAAHRSKGVAANLSIVGLVEPLSLLETAARERRLDDCLTAVDQLAQRLPRFGAELATRLRKTQQTPVHSDEVTSDSVDTSLLRDTLQSLLEAAHRNEWDDQALSTLQQFLPTAYAESLKQTLDALNNFDFTEAVSLLEGLLRKLENSKATT
ncbi:MAG: PAS domain S-box protein [Hahellaceae bacterium]|nr:PAS domain S-box protein [Hahellaceae bacterium]